MRGRQPTDGRNIASLPASRALRAAIALFIGATVIALPGAAAARTIHTAGNWDLEQQRVVMRAGLMTPLGSEGFVGAKPLSAAAESTALGGLAAREGLAPIASSAKAPPLTLVRFDALLVQQLGLAEVAQSVQKVAQEASLAPPSYFGSEVIARYLGLRCDHPAGEDRLELYPWNLITRAEAAHSFAVALGLSNWEIQAAREKLSTFSLPHYTADQLEVLRIAVAKIGMPYVWGGTTDGTEDGLEHGGYDCSGFVWRVYKVSGLPWGAKILGRTAAEQAGEIPRSQRIGLDGVQPADLLFFGSAHFNSVATNGNVIHEALALGNGWAIHSSGQGVYVLPLDEGWLYESFTWARRVI
jgi:cell wall-associated NlpC family hydrolase